MACLEVCETYFYVHGRRRGLGFLGRILRDEKRGICCSEKEPLELKTRLAESRVRFGLEIPKPIFVWVEA